MVQQNSSFPHVQTEKGRDQHSYRQKQIKFARKEMKRRNDGNISQRRKQTGNIYEWSIMGSVDVEKYERIHI